MNYSSELRVKSLNETEKRGKGETGRRNNSPIHRFTDSPIHSFLRSHVLRLAVILLLGISSAFAAEGTVRGGGPKVENAKVEARMEPSKEEGLIQLLEKRKKDLDAREAELKEREARLNQLNRDIEAKVAQYKKMLQEMEGYFKKTDALEKEKASHLVKIYEAMPPKDAAARIEQLDEDTAVLVLSRMKQRAAAKVMSFIEPGMAAGLSRGLVKTFKASEK